MKFLPKQSQCPYCETIYRYGDVRRLMYKSAGECYHCKKKFKVSKKSYLILALEMLVSYILLDAFVLMTIKGLSFYLLFAINLIPICAAGLLMPLYLELKKNEKSQRVE